MVKQYSEEKGKGCFKIGRMTQLQNEHKSTGCCFFFNAYKKHLTVIIIVKKKDMARDASKLGG